MSFAIQNHIDENAIDAVALCKCTLTALALNCETHQPNNFVFLKDDGAATRASRLGNINNLSLMIYLTPSIENRTVSA